MSKNDNKRLLACKYARAFLRIYPNLEQEPLFSALDALAGVYEQSPLAFHVLELSSARIEEKCKGLSKITEQLSLEKPVTQLLKVLLRHKTLNLLPSLIKSIKNEYKKIHHHHDVVVTSAQPLSSEHKKQLECHLAGALPGKLAFLYQLDETLVAGIKVQTPTHYWEYSIARTIRQLEYRVREQGTL